MKICLETSKNKKGAKKAPLDQVNGVPA